jgi:hypothetical protein
VRGAGDAPNDQIKSRVSRDSHMRYEGQGHCTENIRHHTVRFSVHSVEGIPAFPFSRKGFFSPRKDGQDKKVRLNK